MEYHKLLQSLIIVMLFCLTNTKRGDPPYNRYTETSNTTATFTSPYYPRVYPSYTNYTVVVKVDHVRIFNITIYDVNIEKKYDRMWLYKGSEINRETSLIGPISGKRGSYDDATYANRDDGCVVATDKASVTCQLLSTGFTMYFTSDWRVEYGGFVMTYISTWATPSAICEAMQTVNYVSRTVTYVKIAIFIPYSKSDFLPNITCEWFLPDMHSNSLQFVLITVHYFSINCRRHEKLQIWGMNNSSNITEKALKTLCRYGKTFHMPLYDVPHGVRVTYITNSTVSCEGFHLDIQVKNLRNSYVRQQILVSDFTMHNMSIYDLSEQFPFCINNHNDISYCHYIVVEFVTEHGYQIHVTMSPDLIGRVYAFDGPSVDHTLVIYGEPNFQKEMFGWHSNKSQTGFLSVGPYLTMLLRVGTMNSSSLLYYHARSAFSPFNNRLLNCETFGPQAAKLGIFNFDGRTKVKIKVSERGKFNYVCYITMTVLKHSAVSLKIIDIDYYQIPEKCETHGIVVYDGSLNTHNKLGPYCELEKGYMKALFDPLVTASNHVYIMLYMYAKEGDGGQDITVDITTTRCTGVHVIPAVFNNRDVLHRSDVGNETIVKNIAYNTQTRCMTVVFHSDIDNAFYLYEINKQAQMTLSIREYVWMSCYNVREKLLLMSLPEMSKQKSFLAGINKTTTILSKSSHTDIRFAKVYIGENEECTPRLIDACSIKLHLQLREFAKIYFNHESILQGFIYLYDRKFSILYPKCIITLSTGNRRTIISAHYYEMYIHRYNGSQLTITEYMRPNKTFFSHKTVFENRGQPFLLTHQTFSSVSTELVILDVSKAVMIIEYQAMAYKHVPVRIQDRVQINNRYYEFAMYPKTHLTADMAQDKCASGGGNLFSASTLEELEAIKSAIANVWMGHIQQDKYFREFRVDVLIGLHKTIQLDGSTQWRWTDGTPLTITDWYYPDMINHGIPQQFQKEGDRYMVQPEDNARYQCGMMQIYSPHQSTNWRAIDCEEEVPTSASKVFYICEYQHLTTVDSIMNITDVLQEKLNKTMANSSKSDINCRSNHRDCGSMFNTGNNVTNSTNLNKYEQLNTNHTCPTDWTYIQGYCWLLVNSYLELLSHGNMTIHYCHKYGGQLAYVDDIDIVSRYLTYVQHRVLYGSIWVMSQGKPSCVQYRPRHDLMETDGERLVKSSKCVTTTQLLYDGPEQDEYKQFIDQYYPVHCQKGTNDYSTNTYPYSMVQFNITCVPNHVFCVRDVVPVSKTCDVGYLTCADNSCVSPDLVCDGVDDCKTGDDEQGCELPDYWYNCSTGNITISKYCDFFSDCSDGSDEEGCVYPPCSHGQFRCDSGQCVDETRRCNGRHDGCIDLSDETHCKSRENCTNGFYCGDGTCIPNGQEHDGRIDCPSKRDEPYISTYYKLGKSTDYKKCSPVEGRCTETNVGCFNRGEACVLGYDTDGRMRSCSNGAHLYNCSSFECPGRYKCPESYCIDMMRVCNGIQDCQHNEDEAECDDTRSPGLYRCGGDQTYSIDRSQVCDGQFDCARPHSDEKYCSLPECPRGCTCRGFYYNCEGNITHDVSITDANFSVYARTINLANNNLGTTNMFVFTRYSFLAFLRLSGNQIGNVDNATFTGLYNLITLDLSHNMLTTLGQNTFKHLLRLAHLLVHGNLINTILSETFNGLSSIVKLNLSSLSISEIKTGALYGLINLKILDLSANGIRLIERGVFDPGQQLTRVILTGNKMADVPSDVFGDITADVIETDAFRFCCFTNKDLLIDCTPEFGIYSSCDDLMSNRFLQIIIWVIGCLALIGNVAVIICRPIIGIKTPSEVCIFVLSCSDLLTGVYLMILASVDTYYRGGYIINDVKWRESVLCEICGVLSTISTQLSSSLLLLITLDRFIHLVFPMKAVSYSRNTAIVVCMIVFIVALIESVTPVAIESYFGENFYSKTALCLAYDFNDISDGWEYTLVVFILINLFNCIIIVVCYIIIYYSVNRSAQKADPRRKADVVLAKMLFLLILTDLACWFPLIITSLSVFAGHRVPRDMAAILAVIVLPINAAINPYLYTISTIQNARTRRQTGRQTKQTDTQVRQTKQTDTHMRQKKITAQSTQTHPQSGQVVAQASRMTAQSGQMPADPTMMVEKRDVNEQIRHLDEQNRHLSEQNRHLSEQNRDLNQEIRLLTAQFTESTNCLKEQTRQLEQMSQMMPQISELEAENRELSEQKRYTNEQIMHLPELTQRNKHLSDQILDLTEPNRHLSDKLGN